MLNQNYHTVVLELKVVVQELYTDLSGSTIHMTFFANVGSEFDMHAYMLSMMNNSLSDLALHVQVLHSVYLSNRLYTCGRWQ